MRKHYNDYVICRITDVRKYTDVTTKVKMESKICCITLYAQAFSIVWKRLLKYQKAASDIYPLLKYWEHPLFNIPIFIKSEKMPKQDFLWIFLLGDFNNPRINTLS